MINYDKLRFNIIAHPNFKFNWHIQTKPAEELKNRVETIAKIFEKEWDN
jgi:hypothetical protein